MTLQSLIKALAVSLLLVIKTAHLLALRLLAKRLLAGKFLLTIVKTARLMLLVISSPWDLLITPLMQCLRVQKSPLNMWIATTKQIAFQKLTSLAECLQQFQIAMQAFRVGKIALSTFMAGTPKKMERARYLKRVKLAH